MTTGAPLGRLDPGDVRRWVRRLHHFTVTLPRPKEPEGDWLALVWLLDPEHPRAHLERVLGIPPDDPGGFWSTEVLGFAVDVMRHRQGLWMRPQLTGPDLYALTEDDVIRAEALEAAMDAAGLRDWPRATSEPGWVTPATHPEVFADNGLPDDVPPA